MVNVSQAMNVRYVLAGTCATVGILYQIGWLFTVWTILVHLSVGVVAIYLGAAWTLGQGKQYTPPPIPQELLHPRTTIILQNMMEARAHQKRGPKKVVISRNMDLVIQEVIDLVLRDFVLSWYKDLSMDQEALLSFLQSDLWVMIENLSTRLSKIDLVPCITRDVVQLLQEHFQNIRQAAKKSSNDGQPGTFTLHAWLKSEEEELQFLRKVSESLLLVIMPKNYAKSAPIRHLLREVLANTVLKPTVDLMCDPDYINMQLISYIGYREKLSEDTRRTYTYAATYEDFVKMIDKCEDIEHLKQLRFNIMTEIMQATTINNLKKSADKQPGSPKSNKSTGKGELLKARNLKRYINQLTVAKSRCEKRIEGLGGTDYKYYTEDSAGDTQANILPGQKVLSFNVIMESATAREYFENFLKRDDHESLMGFWNAVEKLKECDKRQLHQRGTEIYQRYISSSTSVVKVEKATAKGMESFMLGNTGPEAFIEAQKHVGKVLHNQHYPSFLVSDVYHHYITTLEKENAESANSMSKDELFFEVKEGWSDDDDVEMFVEQSYHAKQKRQQLDSRIMNKSQALQALRTSLKTDPKIQKAGEDLEREVEGMILEKRNLDSHILRTQQWCENQGLWRAHVYEAETSLEGDKKLAIFVLVIHLSGSGGSNLQNSTQGWVVTRKLQDFYTVHEKLVQIGPWLKNVELPKQGRFTTIDARYLNEARTTLNNYLTAIMQDERMAQSEALYGFLTPTPEYFQQPAQKKSGFFLKHILRSFPSMGNENRDGDDDLLFSGDERTDDRTKDSIAEPLYGLINEIYELHGMMMFKWLRKSFISFVEVTFGRSINRQLRETVYWIFSESMLIYYIRNLKDSMWPSGVLAESLPVRTDEEKLRTRIKAKEKFLLNQPDAVKTLVGEENARRGTIKMFEILQDVRLNKQIFYLVLLLLLGEVVPELAAILSNTDDHDDMDTPVVIGSTESR